MTGFGSWWEWFEALFDRRAAPAAFVGFADQAAAGAHEEDADARLALLSALALSFARDDLASARQFLRMLVDATPGAHR